ncbi:MAG: 2TM domain-containing protein [Acidimicrobiales bacterium]
MSLSRSTADAPPQRTSATPELREAARRRAARLRSFYIHCVAFVLGNTMNFAVNWMTLGNGNHQWWFQWALIVWSVALGVHAITVVGNGAWFGADWEERKVRQYLRGEPAPATLIEAPPGLDRETPPVPRGDR